MATYDVSLSRRTDPRFPNRCIHCDAPNPNNTAHTAITVGMAGDRIITLNVYVPCCKQCWLPFSFRFAMQSIGIYLLGGLLGFAIPMAIGLIFMDVKNALVIAFILSLFGGVLGVAAVGTWNAWYPSPFNFKEKDGMIVYLFTRKTFAAEFAKFNNQRVPVSWQK